MNIKGTATTAAATTAPEVLFFLAKSISPSKGIFFPVFDSQ